MHRKRSRLQGGHRVVGAPQPLTQPAYGQANRTPAQGLTTQYGTSSQPGHPPPPLSTQPMQQQWQQQQQQQQQQYQHPQQEQQQQQPPDNSWGWDNESSGAWNWDGGDESSTATRTTQHYNPHHYTQPHVYPHQQQHQHQQSSQQQPPLPQHHHLGKPVESTTYGHSQPLPASSAQSSQPQQQAPQYMNGGSRNGNNNTDEWGNWGEDWGCFDNSNNNNNIVSNSNSKAVTCTNQENTTANESQQNYQSYQQQVYHHPQQQQQQQQHQHQHQQQQQHQQQGQYPQKASQQLHHNQYTPHPQQPQNLHHEQPENSQSNLKQQYSNTHHYQQQQQQQPEQKKTQQQTDDAWDWENDDWQINGLVPEQPQETGTPQPSPHTAGKVSGEPAGHVEASPSPHTTAVNATNAAGDGWPDWEEQTHVTESHASQQQQQDHHHHHHTAAEPASSFPGDDGGEVGMSSSHQGVSQWSHQHWDGSWEHHQGDTQVEDPHQPSSVTQTVTTTATFTTTITTTTTNTEPRSYSQYDSYQHIPVETTGGYEVPAREQLPALQEHRDTGIVSTAADRSSHMQHSGSNTTTTTATSLQPSTIMMNNFDDDNWGDGWGEVEPPQTQQVPHITPESTCMAPDSHTQHSPALQHPESTPHTITQPHQDTPQHQETGLSTYSNEGTSEAWDSTWDEEDDKVKEPAGSEVQMTSISKYSVHVVAGEMAQMTLSHQPTVEASFLHPSGGDESLPQPIVREESSHTPVSEGYPHSVTTEESYTQSTPAEESHSQFKSGEESFSHPPTGEESYSQHPTTSESLPQFTSHEGPSAQPPTSRDSSTHPTSVKASFHPPASEGYHHPPISEGYQHPSVSEGYYHPPASKGYYHLPASEGYHHPPAHHPSVSEGYHHPPVSEGYHHPPTSEGYHHPPVSEGYHHPPTSEGYHHPSMSEECYHPSASEGYDHPPASEGYHHPPASEGYHHSPASEVTSSHSPSTEGALPLANEVTSSHSPRTEGALTLLPDSTTHPPPHRPHPSSMAYLEQGVEGAVILHPQGSASPSSQAPAPPPPQQQPQVSPPHHPSDTYPQEPTPQDPDRLGESPHPSHSPHLHHIPPSHTYTHHPSPSPSPHRPPPHPHHPSPSPSPNIPLSHPHHPSPSPSPHTPQEASTQDVNLEVAPPQPPVHPAVVDPMFSRVPDGASSIPEGPPASSTGMTNERQGEGQSEAAEAPWQGRPAGGSSSVPEGSAEHQPLPHPTHLSVDRPASNQSAHSVHSIHSAHSTHSMTLNQEVPLDEIAETQASSTSSASHQAENIGGVPSGGDPSASKPSWEGGTVSSSVPGPHGTVPSLKARKGSPFQPPTGRDSPSASTMPQSYQYFPSQSSAGDPVPTKPPTTAYPDVGANLETLPDNNELLSSATEQSSPPLWSTVDTMTTVKLTVAAPPLDSTPAPVSTSVQAPPPSNSIPLVVPGLIKEEKPNEAPMALQQPPRGMHSEPPAAHSANLQAAVTKPKVQSFSTIGNIGTPSSPAVLDLSKPSRVPLEATTAEDRPQGDRDTPSFSRMVPGESRKGESAAAAPPTYQTPAVVPSMPSERVVTGNDNPQPVVAVGTKQEPSEVRSPPDGPDTSHHSSQVAQVVVPPVRSETIGSEEPKLRNFTSGNSGSRSDLAGGERSERGERGSGRWERDHSRDRAGDSGSHRGTSDRYRDRSRERGSTRDYYRDDSPHSRRSYDRDYDDRRRWRGRDSDEDEDSDRRYYDSRDRRERAYRDEMDRYSDRPVREDGKERRDGNKRRDYKDRSKDSYRGGYDDDPYYGGSGRGDRSQPLSRSSSINNLEDADRSSHHHHHRSLHHHHHHHPRDYYDPRDSRSRDSDPRDRDASYASRDHRDYYMRGWEGRDGRRDQRYYGSARGYEDMYELYHQYYPYSQYYKDYYQWMKQYQQAYQSESFYDDRTSIHSGRSSVNNEAEKSVSSGELSGAPSVGDDTVSEPAQRMTPVHFGRPHISARFTPSGQLVMVLPKDPRDGEKAVVQLRDVQKMLCVDPSESRAIQLMKNYPGPLTLSDTHKDVVMKHCEHQVAEAARSLTLPDKESVMLIWEYLALLVKQNGKLFGSDIAGLLLKGREVSHAPTLTSPHMEEQSEDVPPDASPQDEGIDLPPQPPAPPPGRDEAALLRKFTEYLCLGRKKEAVDYAIREGLWGHALTLAYKMDSTTHTRALAAFMGHIPRTDVLLTLFQQLSGKKPEITKSYSPQHWGDWRQHLAVMISNPTGAINKDQASIVALGDALAARGQLHAAHFCYLVAEVKWGSYTCKDSKLVLIGASHHLPFQAFATIEAIQCTEVFEFARSLDSNNIPPLDTFQSYKLVYALRLTECGFPAEALRYCEVINQSVEKSPTSYKVEFLSQVYDLASRLKYHDLHYQMYQGEVSEMPDPEWLTNLRTALDTARQQEHQKLLELQQDTTTTEGIQSHSQMYPQKQSTEEFSQALPVDSNYSVAETSQAQVPLMDPHGLSYSVPSSQPYQPHEYVGGQPSPDVTDSLLYNTTSRSPSKGGEAAPMNHHPQGVVGFSQEEGPSAAEVPMIPQASPEHSQYHQDTSYHSGYHQQMPYLHPSSQPPTNFEQGSGGEQTMSTDISLSQANSQVGYPTYHQQDPYQPWGQSSAQPQPTEGGSMAGMAAPPDAPTKPAEPPAPQQTQRTPEEEAYWAEMSNKKESSDMLKVGKGRHGQTHSLKQHEGKTKRVSFKPQSGGSNSNNNSGIKETQAEETKPEEDKKKNAGKENKAANASKGGWLSSLLPWKSSTPKAILPDDNNPQIVWDPDKKKWVNKDGTEETTAPVGPPPKMPQPGRGLHSSISRSANRTTRYVDPMKDKGTGPAGTQPPSMLPPMAMNSPSVSPSLMVPHHMQPTQESQEAGNASPQPQSQQQQQQQQQQPQQPPQVPEVAQGMLSEEARGPVPMMAPPMGQPQFFDPSQFKPSPGAPANPARRTGPGRRSFPGNR